MPIHPEGVEPPTYGAEVRCSIQLSYGCISIGDRPAGGKPPNRSRDYGPLTRKEQGGSRCVKRGPRHSPHSVPPGHCSRSAAEIGTCDHPRSCFGSYSGTTVMSGRSRPAGTIGRRLTGSLKRAPWAGFPSGEGFPQTDFCRDEFRTESTPVRSSDFGEHPSARPDPLPGERETGPPESVIPAERVCRFGGDSGEPIRLGDRPTDHLVPRDACCVAGTA